MSCTRLAAYTASDPIHDELQGLLSSWNDLLADLGCNRELAILRDAGCFDSVPSALREGLGVRNCWLKVFEDEPLRSVLCADEKNLYTRIPVLLGRQRGLPTFACHHGALDGRYLFSEVCADRILAKGLMEWDYLVSGCGVPKENVSIAAPSRPRAVAGPAGWTRRSVVFFSEPYENLGSRARDVYIEVLPRLARIAESYGCELVVKLHPFESRRGRKRLVEQTVLREKRTGIHVIAGPMTETLLQRAWFGVTVSSTTAVDCALKGVPAFLCSWLDSNEYKYADQFAKFGAAEVLRSGEDLENIPKLLESFRAADPQTLWHAAEPRALRELLLGGSESVQTLSGGARVERLWA